MNSLPRAIPKHGPVADRWRDHRDRSRVAVFLRVRAAGGRCEAEDCSSTATDLAHLFGRRHIIEEPWASSPECCLGLCRGCHNSVDRGLAPDLLERLRWQAVVRLCGATRQPIPSVEDHDVLGAIRTVVDALEAQSC